MYAFSMIKLNMISTIRIFSKILIDKIAQNVED